MRELNPDKKKQKASKFFEFFEKKYGPGGLVLAPPDIINRNSKLFFTDLIEGNLTDDRYLQALQTNQEVIRIMVRECSNRVLEAYIVLQSLTHAMNTNRTDITGQPGFQVIYSKYNTRYQAYSSILQNLNIFMQTRDPRAIVSLSAIGNSQTGYGAKQQILY